MHIQTLLNESNPYNVEVIKHENGFLVRFGEYGLKGGGTWELICTGVQVGGGVALAAGTGGAALPVLGSILISTGISGGTYVVTASKEEFNGREYLKQTLMGIPVGLVGGVAGAAAKGCSLAARVGSQMIAGAISAPISEAIKERDKTGENPSAKLLGKKALSGMVGGLAGGLAGAAAGEAVNSAADLNKVFQKTLEGAASGAAGAGITTATTNVMEEKELSEGVLKSVALGGAFGGIMGAADQINKNNQASDSEITRIQQGIIKPEMGLKYAKHPMSSLHKRPTSEGTFQTRQYKTSNNMFKKLEKTPSESPKPQDPSAPLSPQLFLCSKARAEQAVNNVGRAMQPDSVVEFTDCTSNELFKHIVLVHAINDQEYIHARRQDTLNKNFKLNEISEAKWGEIFGNAQYRDFRSTLALLGIITHKGEIGHHLNFEQREFDNELIDRPTVHWAMNQLVDPHSYSWEKAQIAVLEPFGGFEKSKMGMPINLAPYDTFSIGMHKLSENSIILIPDHFNEMFDAENGKLKDHYKDFKGKFVTYDRNKSIREAIHEALNRHYPDVWHLCNENGELTGKIAQSSAGGYPQMTCIKRDDGKVVRLLQGSNRIKGEALNVEGFMVELHADAERKIFKVSGGRNPYFQALGKFKSNPEYIKDSELFPANIDSVEKLKKMGSLHCLENYNHLNTFHPATNCHVLAEYLIKEAIYADLVSFLMKKEPDRNKWNLSRFDYKLLIQPKLPYTINFLENIVSYLAKNDDQSLQEAMTTFGQYTAFLEEKVAKCQQAKLEAGQILNLPNKTPMKGAPAYLEKGKKEWEQVSKPDEITFDLGSQWPLSEELRCYIDQICWVLPKDTKELTNLYHFLKPNDENTKENYRCNVIRSLIRTLIQEQRFLANEDDAIDISQSIFLQKVPDMDAISPFADYGLFYSDNTKTLGNCFFDNVAVQLGMSVDDSWRLRERLTTFMHEHSNEYRWQIDLLENPELAFGNGGEKYFYSSWEEYLNLISNDRVWATQVEVAAMAKECNHPIVLFSDKAAPSIYNRESNEEPLFLYHQQGSHFSSLFPCKQGTREDVYRGIKEKIENEEEEANWPMQTMSLLNLDQTTSKEIITALSKKTKLVNYYAKPAGVVEGYTVEEHTEMVLDIAKKYRESLELNVAPLLPWNEFLLFLALHEIGKGISNKIETQAKHPNLIPKALELKICQEILVEMMQELGISEENQKILGAMLMYDSQGEYLRGNMEIEQVADEIKEMAQASETDSLTFYRLYQTYHLVRAASYPNLQPLFQFEENNLHHCEGNQMMVDALKEQLGIA